MKTIENIKVDLEKKNFLIHTFSKNGLSLTNEFENEEEIKIKFNNFKDFDFKNSSDIDNKIFKLIIEANYNKNSKLYDFSKPLSFIDEELIMDDKEYMKSYNKSLNIIFNRKYQNIKNDIKNRYEIGFDILEDEILINMINKNNIILVKFKNEMDKNVHFMNLPGITFSVNKKDFFFSKNFILKKEKQILDSRLKSINDNFDIMDINPKKIILKNFENSNILKNKNLEDFLMRESKTLVRGLIKSNLMENEIKEEENHIDFSITIKNDDEVDFRTN